MANQHTKAKELKAKRVAAAHKAWITIRERRAAREFNAVASKIAISHLPETIAASARKIARAA
jgi:hypothetical protein